MRSTSFGRVVIDACNNGCKATIPDRAPRGPLLRRDEEVMKMGSRHGEVIFWVKYRKSAWFCVNGSLLESAIIGQGEGNLRKGYLQDL